MHDNTYYYTIMTHTSNAKCFRNVTLINIRGLAKIIVPFRGYDRHSPNQVIIKRETCLATDACLTADPGVASSIPAQSHTFVEIDHEIISTVILLPSADSFKKGCCQLQAKVCAQITG